jgi:SAM-dependent methyltransferase
MIIVSDLLNVFYKTKLQSSAYRKKVYEQAFNKQLRGDKLGIVLLRNLNEKMSSTPALHGEIIDIIGEENYQKNFWESDFGFLWYQGNLKAKNFYFNFGLNQIREFNCQSVLDVGCGWGEFSAEASKLDNVTVSLGIDISDKIIDDAKHTYGNTKAKYEFKTIFDIIDAYDLVTLFGSTDYIHPTSFRQALEKILSIAQKKVIIVNSLRGTPIDLALTLKESLEIRRYDIGYVHPIKYLLDDLSKYYSFTYTIQKAGLDSVLVDIIKT